MNKKGFTLIELLAVIIILAIIALIATPIILNMIGTSKKGAAVDSAYGYIDALETNNAMNSIDPNKYPLIDGTIDDITNIDLQIKGQKPASGTIIILNGKVKEATMCINGYTVEYDGKKAKATKKCEEPEVIVYKEELLNGADPVIKENLIPVTIDDDGTVTKAKLDEEWYSYGKKKWANAVVLFDGKTVETDGRILEENIREYFVWIPKYSYKLWNVDSNNENNVGKPIEITFGSEAKTTGQTNGQTLIHPAFTNFDTDGIWVGKYETSYDEASYTNKDLFLTKNPNFDSATNPNNIIIKPNVRSLTNKNVSTLYTLLKNSNTNLNSHMMTNMEWGATAYLTYSKYGRCTDTTCTEVTINNINTGYYGSDPVFSGQWNYGATITGCAADTVSAGYVSNAGDCPNKYNTTKGYLASTTGNISGIYDISGGNWEYVMGVIKDGSDKPYSGQNSTYNSGFKGSYGKEEGSNTTGLDFPTDSRYYNLYEANSTTLGDDTWWKYDNGMLGDATKEIANTKADSSSSVGLWFNDYAGFPAAISPWFVRGGYWSGGASAGVFYFYRRSGHADGYQSARLVLAY